MSPPILVAALSRAAEGWAVHPLFGIIGGRCECRKGSSCPTPGKHPRLDNWPEEATLDPVKIRQWWQRWPNSNVGGAAGKKSGRNTLDVDPRHGGDVSLELLERRYSPLPEGQETHTGSGGRHIRPCSHIVPPDTSETLPVSGYRSLYRQVTEAISDDCFAVDPHWLIGAHPQAWEQLRTLDDELTEMERTGAEEQAYRVTLGRLVGVCKGANTL